MFVWKIYDKGPQYDKYARIKGLFLFGIIPIFMIIEK